MGSVWRGETSLAVTFWGYFVAGTILIQIVFAAIGAAVIYGMYSGVDDLESVKGMVALFVVASLYFLVLLPYLVFSTIAVWRSAGAFEGALVWPVLARVFAAGFLVFIAVSLVFGF